MSLNAANVVVIALLFGVSVLLYLRTEKSRKWLTALFLVLPVLAGIYGWASGLNLWLEGIVGVVAGLALNIVYWVVHGRHHPPGTSDSIRVIGMEDE